MRFSDTQDQDFIPILTEEDEAAINDSPLPDALPLLARDAKGKLRRPWCRVLLHAEIPRGLRELMLTRVP